MSKKLINKPLKEEPLDVSPPVPISPQVQIEVPKTITGPEEVTVNNIAQAESLQKSGWQLIDCHQTPKGKTFKFRKVKK